MLAAFAAGVADKPAPRVVLSRALEVGDAIVAALRAHPASERVELAGSARRLVDSVKDLDIVATASDPPALLAALGEIGLVEEASGTENNTARARTHKGIALDLRVVEPDQFGNVMQHLTGSKNHNMALRERRSAAACTSPSTASSTTRPARRTAARPRRRSTRSSGSRGSRPSCARTAASCASRAPATCRP